MEKDYQIRSVGENMARQASGEFDRTTVLRGLKRGCLKHLNISSFHRL